VPAYNEELRLPPTLDTIAAFVRDTGADAEIIVVDNGSRDRTAQRVAEAMCRMPFLRLIRNSLNTGKDQAVLDGLRAATRPAVLFTDADLSTPIADVSRLWASYDKGFDIVIGSRRHKDSCVPVPQPIHRRVVGRVFNGLVRLICLRGYSDTQCGFKLFRKSALDVILPRLRTTGFAFDVEMLLRARECGLRVAEIGVTWRNSPDTRMRILSHGSRMVVQLLKMRGLW
jgi:dolichyl-phosphate beta-glucosyltransferase